MSAATAIDDRPRRGRLRSRLRLGALGLACALLVGCAGHFGPGLAELAAGTGWEPLPIENWVVNDGITPVALVYCPNETCLRPAAAAILTFDGKEADALERGLAQSPAALARRFSASSGRKAPAKVESTTSVTRFRPEASEEAGQGGAVKGLVVDIRARKTGRLASTAILYARQDGKLVVGIAVTNDSQAARDYVKAAWASRRDR